MIEAAPVHFARFDAVGRYTTTGIVPADSPTLSEPDVYIGSVVPETQYHGADGPVDMQPQPSPMHVFDFAAKAWVDPRTLDDIKAARWEEMKVLRQTAIEAPLVTPYGTFDADAESRANIINSAHLMQTEAQTLAPGSQPTDDFTLADDSVVTLTAGEMVNVALLLAAQIKTAYARGREVRSAIAAAATPEAVEAITWSTP